MSYSSSSSSSSSSSKSSSSSSSSSSLWFLENLPSEGGLQGAHIRPSSHLNFPRYISLSDQVPPSLQVIQADPDAPLMRMLLKNKAKAKEIADRKQASTKRKAETSLTKHTKKLKDNKSSLHRSSSSSSSSRHSQSQHPNHQKNSQKARAASLNEEQDPLVERLNKLSSAALETQSIKNLKLYLKNHNIPTTGTKVYMYVFYVRA